MVKGLKVTAGVLILLLLAGGLLTFLATGTLEWYRGEILTAYKETVILMSKIMAGVLAGAGLLFLALWLLGCRMESEKEDGKL